MKKLFIRFFKNKDDQIPMDSYHLSGAIWDEQQAKFLLPDSSDVIIDWMVQHPIGKVDIVWLNF
jgi:hypothetical protein